MRPYAMMILMLSVICCAADRMSAGSVDLLNKAEMSNIRAGDGACEEAVPDADQSCSKCVQTTAALQALGVNWKKCADSNVGSTCMSTSPTIYDCWSSPLECTGAMKYYSIMILGVCQNEEFPFGAGMPDPLCDHVIGIAYNTDNCYGCP